MSEPWEKIADEIKDVLIDESDSFVKEKTDEYKEFAKDIGKRVAKAALAVKMAKTDELRAAAKEDFGYLRDALESRIASSGLDFVEQGELTLKKVLAVALRFILPLVAA